jgi:hypothetical protein
MKLPPEPELILCILVASIRFSNRTRILIIQAIKIQRSAGYTVQSFKNPNPSPFVASSTTPRIPIIDIVMQLIPVRKSQRGGHDKIWLVYKNQQVED